MQANRERWLLYLSFLELLWVEDSAVWVRHVHIHIFLFSACCGIMSRRVPNRKSSPLFLYVSHPFLSLFQHGKHVRNEWEYMRIIMNHVHLVYRAIRVSSCHSFHSTPPSPVVLAPALDHRAIPGRTAMHSKAVSECGTTWHNHNPRLFHFVQSAAPGVDAWVGCCWCWVCINLVWEGMWNIYVRTRGESGTRVDSCYLQYA